MQSKAADRPTTSSEADSLYFICKAEGAKTDGDVVQWSDTDSSDNPLGVSVEDSVADDGRLAGVIALGDIDDAEYGFVQTYGYNVNITTDGAVGSADKWLKGGAGVAVGATDAEVEADITTADISSLADLLGWNVKDDVGTVGEGFIRKMGNL